MQDLRRGSSQPTLLRNFAESRYPKSRTRRVRNNEYTGVLVDCEYPDKYDILTAVDLSRELVAMANIHVYVREVRASLGLANGLLYTISRLFDKTTGGRCRLIKYYFVAQPVPAPSPTYARVSKTRVYRISPDNSVVRQFPRPSSVIEKRFADGAICFVAEQSGTFVGFLWIKQERYREDEVKCDYWLHPPAEVVWDFDTYVKPAFRMGRAFAQLWEGANQFLRDHGYRWTVSRISAFNAASLASHRRLGIVHLDTGVFFVAGELQLAVVSRPPFLHVSIRPDRVLRLDFHAPATDAK